MPIIIIVPQVSLFGIERSYLYQLPIIIVKSDYISVFPFLTDTNRSTI